MQFDIKTVGTHEPYPIERIACPVLTISAEDDRFGTASRSREIATNMADGRAIIFPTGGHALASRSLCRCDARGHIVPTGCATGAPTEVSLHAEWAYFSFARVDHPA
jgi:predicted alpha/beta hydrolase family esterase